MFALWMLALLPAVLGVAVLAVGATSRWLGPARTLAFGAASAVILGELLPHASDTLGIGAWLLAASAALLPLGLDRALTRWKHADTGTPSGVTLGYLALLAHQAFDGAQAGAARTLGLGVVLAVSLHGAPLVAAAVLACSDRAQAFRRGLGLIAATAVGLAFSFAVPADALETASPWLSAGIAGFLLHVVSHDLDRDLPTARRGHVVELIAFCVGVTLTLGLMDQGTHDHHGAAGATFLPVVQGMVEPISLVVILGLFLTQRYPRWGSLALHVLTSIAVFGASAGLLLGLATSQRLSRLSRTPALATGLAIAACLYLSLGQDALAPWAGTWQAWTLLLLVALPIRLDPMVLFPVAATAISLGLSRPEVYVATVLASTIDARDARTYSRVSLGFTVVGCLGAIAAGLTMQTRPLLAPMMASLPHPLILLLQVILLADLAYALSTVGVRGWAAESERNIPDPWSSPPDATPLGA